MECVVLLPNKVIDLTIAPSIPLCIHKTLITLDILHMFFDTTTREMIALSTILNPLSIFLRKDQFKLLLFSARPNIVVNLVVLTPHQETRIVINLKEMIAHLVI